MLRTPDYQGYADRVTPALDRLLVGYQEVQRRRSEDRQFARQQVLQRSQQDFQRSMAQQQMDFQRELHVDRQDLQLHVLGEQQDFQRDLVGRQEESATRRQERGFEHDREMLNIRMSAEAQQKAQSTVLNMMDDFT